MWPLPIIFHRVNLLQCVCVCCVWNWFTVRYNHLMVCNFNSVIGLRLDFVIVSIHSIRAFVIYSNGEEKRMTRENVNEMTRSKMKNKHSKIYNMNWQLSRQFGLSVALFQSSYIMQPEKVPRLRYGIDFYYKIAIEMTSLFHSHKHCATCNRCMFELFHCFFFIFCAVFSLWCTFIRFVWRFGSERDRTSQSLLHRQTIVCDMSKRCTVCGFFDSFTSYHWNRIEMFSMYWLNCGCVRFNFICSFRYRMWYPYLKCIEP